MKRKRNRRQYPNLGARASRLFRARSGMVFTVGHEMRPPIFVDRKTFDALVAGVPANNPDTEVSEIHPPSIGLLGDVNAQFSRLDRAIAGLK